MNRKRRIKTKHANQVIFFSKHFKRQKLFIVLSNQIKQLTNSNDNYPFFESHLLPHFS